MTWKSRLFTSSTTHDAQSAAIQTIGSVITKGDSMLTSPQALAKTVAEITAPGKGILARKKNLNTYRFGIEPVSWKTKTAPTLFKIQHSAFAESGGGRSSRVPETAHGRRTARLFRQQAINFNAYAGWEKYIV